MRYLSRARPDDMLEFYSHQARRMGEGVVCRNPTFIRGLDGLRFASPILHVTGRHRRRRPVVGFDFDFPRPVGAAEHRSPFAMKRASCLRRPCISGAELGERANGREAQGTRRSGPAFGSPFFWVLFFGEAKKSTSPSKGRKEGPIERLLSESGDCRAALAMTGLHRMTAWRS